MSHAPPIPLSTRDACIEIMDRGMKRPCAALFREPVNPDRDGAPNYYSVIKRPTDLGTIRRRLVDDEYQNIGAWSREMNLIWGNAEKFHGRGSLLTSLALEIRRTFEKEYEKLKVLSIEKWVETVSELKDRLDSPPDLVSDFATISERPDPNQEKPFTEEEKDQFIRASMWLSSKQDGRRMLHMIRCYEPHFGGAGGSRQIDVGGLSASTLHALRVFVCQRLSEMGLRYPE
jgi:hypothetical protein